MLLFPPNLATPFVVSGRVTTLNLHVEIKAQTYCFRRFRQVLSNYIDSDIGKTFWSPCQGKTLDGEHPWSGYSAAC